MLNFLYLCHLVPAVLLQRCVVIIAHEHKHRIDILKQVLCFKIKIDSITKRKLKCKTVIGSTDDKTPKCRQSTLLNHLIRFIVVNGDDCKVPLE